MTEALKQSEPLFLNGLNVTAYDEIVAAVTEDHSLAKFRFRATNAWTGGGFNRTVVGSFFGAGEEHGAGERRFDVYADEPPVLLGLDRAPNPVEFLLHALAACLTSSIIYKAAAKGIAVQSIESSFEGDLDALKFLELSDDGRLGYEGIRARFKVKADATEQEIIEMMEFSPVLDVLRNGTQVSLHVEAA